MLIKELINSDETVADNSHYHHYRWWCTFFKPVPLFCIENTKYWPIFAHLGTILHTFWCPFYREREMLANFGYFAISKILVEGFNPNK